MFVYINILIEEEFSKLGYTSPRYPVRWSLWDEYVRPYVKRGYQNGMPPM